MNTVAVKFASRHLLPPGLPFDQIRHPGKPMPGNPPLKFVVQQAKQHVRHIGLVGQKLIHAVQQ